MAPMPGAGEVLEVRGAVRTHPGGRGLHGAALSLRAGELYALLGPNGAGKTSLVRAICGRLRLDAGEVRVFGRDPRSDRGVRRRIGLVPQEIALYPDLTARENLQALGRLAGLGAADATAAAARGLAWVGLEDRADSLARTLSGGMRRRLNLAAGVLHAPGLVLLDEPTAGVDPGAREQLHALLRDLRDRGAALLLATHDLEQAEELADRVGLLVDGRVREEGTPAELVEKAFRGAREVGVTLARAPDATQQAALRHEGLAPDPGGQTWTGPLPGGLDALAGLGERLARGELAVAELRLREPGLRGVFLRLTESRQGSP